MKKQFYIYGTGGHALSALDLLISSSFSGDIAFIEDHKKIDSYYGYPVYNYFPQNNCCLYIAIGDNTIRKDLFNNHQDKEFVNIISPGAYTSRITELGKNIFIGNQTHIGPGITIGDNCIINTGAIIEHETRIGKHSHISVHATVAGNVTIGNEVLICAGATIKNNISICDKVIIGAGSVVVKDINDSGIYTGIPAKKLKEFS